jgi:hypothetical protein
VDLRGSSSLGGEKNNTDNLCVVSKEKGPLVCREERSQSYMHI